MQGTATCQHLYILGCMHGTATCQHLCILGCMQGTVHRDLLKEQDPDLQTGTVLVLKQVTFFTL